MQALIVAGHRRDDVMSYTLAQVRAYLGAIGRQQQRAVRDAAIAARVAQADDKRFKAYLEQTGG